jgi:hypothetical protein
MKKKGSRAIPDFSRTPTRGKGDTVPQSTGKRAVPAAPRPAVKPSTTSTKSGGRRGQ